jgi:hypothetical protein
MSETSALPPISVLYQVGTGHYFSQALNVAAKLGVADLLKDGPRQADDLAQACGAHGPSLRRVLRLLVAAGVFVENEDGSFGLTPAGELMHTPQGRAFVQLFAGEMVQRLWSELLYSVQTGRPGYEQALGMEPFEYMAAHPEEATNFDLAMTAASSQTAVALAAAYDFSAFRTIVDVGGGQGVLLSGILKAFPHLRGTLFDLPRVVHGGKWIETAGVADRCEVTGGDFFESVPAGGDAYLLKHVIHDWNDERAVVILRNVRRQVKADGKLLIVEGVYPARVEQSPASRGAASNDVNMMVATGGRQRSEQEFRELYAAAEFRLSRIVPTQSPACVIEGVPV